MNKSKFWSPIKFFLYLIESQREKNNLFFNCLISFKDWFFYFLIRLKHNLSKRPSSIIPYFLKDIPSFEEIFPYKDGIIFIHIPKNGGTSIATALGIRSLQCHISAKDLKKKIGSKIWDNSFKFTFVRNPWEKLVSQYHYSGKQTSLKFFGKQLSFKEYLIRFIDTEESYLPNPFDQLSYITDENGKILVDFIGRFEFLQEDFNKICQNQNIGKIKLPHLNSSTHSHYRHYFDSFTKELIRKKFKRDISFLNYKF